MPILPKQTMQSPEPTALTFTALDGTNDAFNYSGSGVGSSDILIFQNTSGGDVPLTLLGDQATNVSRAGITVIDVSGGKQFVVPANSYVKVTLKNADAYLTDSAQQPKITGGSASINAAHLVL